MSSQTVLEPRIEIRTELAPRYQVVLLDDDDHTYDYVIEMLGRLFGMPVPTAYSLAQEVDRSGRVIVYTGAFEHAEFKREQIQGYGSDPRLARCRGSMAALIERAD